MICVQVRRFCLFILLEDMKANTSQKKIEKSNKREFVCTCPGSRTEIYFITGLMLKLNIFFVDRGKFTIKSLYAVFISRVKV